jgi:prepilin-type processing-associated H-X9-DG protein
MLLPAISNAKARAQTTNCLNNLRQWSIALHANAADSQDHIPRDGTDTNGTYSPDTGATTGPGSPNDPFAWFNVLPWNLGEQPLSNYTAKADSTLQDNENVMPFPGNAFGKIWHCPAARALGAESFLKSGQYGFFSYVMNIDLKLKSTIANGVANNSYTWPFMPSLGSLRNPAAIVMLTEVTFSPSLENFVVASDSGRTGVYPAARWSYFPKRHNNRGNIVFLDGHAATFSWTYVVNGGNPSTLEEPTSSPGNFNDPDIWWNPNRDR